jgi:catechol 2,3-dioxygenase-like lactoylglutathione lyase family enzyme
MTLSLGRIHQIAVQASDLDQSVAFYRDTLGAEFIARFDPPGLAFFRFGDTRILLEKAGPPATLYFRVADLSRAYDELRGRGVRFDSEPHLIHRDEEGYFGPPGTEEWMAFFRDPDGNLLALAAQVAPGG